MIKHKLKDDYRNRTSRMVGRNYLVAMGSLVGIIGITFYNVAIGPMLNPEPYQKIQDETRAGIDQEKIQPGNMKVWSDPFDREEKNKKRKKPKEEQKLLVVT